MNNDEEIRNDFVVNSDRKKLWNAQLDILNNFDLFCKKHNLKYFVVDGTLLGAVRHKGFIPWDDDIDVGMLREDYDKLILLSKEYNKENKDLFLQSSFTDKLIRNHIQIRNKKTTCLIKSDYKAKYNCGIFIDVFPLDKIPDDNKEIITYFNKIKRYYKSISKPKKKAGFNQNYLITFVYNNFLYYMLNFFYKLKIILRGGKNKCCRKFEKLCAKYKDYNLSKITYVSFNSLISKYDMSFDLKDYNELVELPFEDIKVICPKGFDSILKKEYGDYMIFKKGESSHGSIFVDLNNPYSKYKKYNRKKFINLFN